MYFRILCQDLFSKVKSIWLATLSKKDLIFIQNFAMPSNYLHTWNGHTLSFQHKKKTLSQAHYWELCTDERVDESVLYSVWCDGSSMIKSWVNQQLFGFIIRSSMCLVKFSLITKFYVFNEIFKPIDNDFLENKNLVLIRW